jgi:CubicO group peptidase (beta-lactamase class C family)
MLSVRRPSFPGNASLSARDMKTFRPLLLQLLLLLFTLGGQSQTQAQSRRIAHAASRNDLMRLRRLELQFEQLRSLLRIPGMSAAIVKDQKLLWAKGFGYADLEKRVPATPNTLYYIASLTKTFATTALMQLVEQGKLDLDEPMSKYSSDFKYDQVKVKHVLSHTSGGTPGDRFSYDGARFALLTSIVENKTGKSFRQAITEMFLDPLNMSDSVPSQDVLTAASENAALFRQDKLARYKRTLARYAQPYRLYGDQIVHTTYPWAGISTSAGLLSTVADLSKFDIAIDRHVYLKKETQDRSWTPFVSNSGRPLVHGLGWFVQNYDGLKYIWHFGNDPDEFSGTYIKLPEKGLSLILLANSDALSSPFYRSGILTSSPFLASFIRIFVSEAQAGHTLPDPNWASNPADFANQLSRLKKPTDDYSYDGEQRAYATMMKWLDDKRKHTFTEIRVNPRIYDAYLGQYQLTDGAVLTVSKDGSHLLIQQSGNEKIELYAQSSVRFFTKAIDLELMFVTGGDGTVTKMEIYQDGQTLVAKKIK